MCVCACVGNQHQLVGIIITKRQRANSSVAHVQTSLFPSDLFFLLSFLCVLFMAQHHAIYVYTIENCFRWNDDTECWSIYLEHAMPFVTRSWNLHRCCSVFFLDLYFDHFCKCLIGHLLIFFRSVVVIELSY